MVPVEIHEVSPVLRVCWAEDQAKNAMNSLLRSDCCSRFQSYQQLSIGDVLDPIHQLQAQSSRDKTNNRQPNVAPQQVKPCATKHLDRNANMFQVHNKNSCWQTVSEGAQQCVSPGGVSQQSGQVQSQSTWPPMNKRGFKFIVVVHRQQTPFFEREGDICPKWFMRSASQSFRRNK